MSTCRRSDVSTWNASVQVWSAGWRMACVSVKMKDDKGVADSHFNRYLFKKRNLSSLFVMVGTERAGVGQGHRRLNAPSGRHTNKPAAP